MAAVKDDDTYYIFGTAYSRREVEHLEDISGKTTLAGDLIRFHDARTELGRTIRDAFLPLFRGIERLLNRVRS